MKEVANKPRIVFLDYLRIIAFVSVLIVHEYYRELLDIIADTSYSEITRFVAQYIILPVCRNGVAGVVIFFLVSGYIITEILRVETTRQFLICRIFRIYPLYGMAVLLELLSHDASGLPFPPLSVVLIKFMLLGDFFNIPTGLNGVEWTLRIEILFYALMALVKSVKIYESKKILFGGMAVLTVVMAGLYPFPEVSAGLRTGAVSLFIPFIFIGVAMNLYKHNEISGLWTIMLIGFISSIFLHIHNAYYDPPQVNYYVIGVGVFLLFYFLQNKLKYNRLVIFIAGFSYSVYLFHTLLIEFVEYQLSAIPHHRIIAFILFICFMAVIHFLVEKPLIKIGHKLSGKSGLNKL